MFTKIFWKLFCLLLKIVTCALRFPDPPHCEMSLKELKCYLQIRTRTLMLSKMLWYYKTHYVKKVSAFLWCWCKSIYVKEIISTLQTVLFRQKRLLKIQKKSSAPWLQPVDLRRPLKLSKKKMSYCRNVLRIYNQAKNISDKLFFMWNRALRKKFNFYFSGVFG